VVGGWKAEGKPAISDGVAGHSLRTLPCSLWFSNTFVIRTRRLSTQVMECGDRALLDQWIAAWRDIVDFEVIPVISSAEAAAHVSSSETTNA
jgi:hypothetical protein